MSRRHVGHTQKRHGTSDIGRAQSEPAHGVEIEKIGADQRAEADR